MHVMIMHGATYTSCPLTKTVQYTLLVVLLFYLGFLQLLSAHYTELCLGEFNILHQLYY
jgi:hypothetical protein